MSDLNTDTGQAGSDGEAFIHQLPTDAPQAVQSPSDAARLLASLRKPKQIEPAAPIAAAAEQPSEAAKAEDSDSPPETPAETTEEAPDQADALPPIEPPKSWKADEKERFKTLPRETQEYLAERETERDREFRRSQNEAAEKLKGLTAKEQAVELARQQYEAALPQLQQTLQANMAGEFADIKTIADVQKMAAEDPFRYARWDFAQKQIAAVQAEAESAKQRQAQERQQHFAEFAKKQDELLREKIPDLADNAKADKLQKQAMKVLSDIGFNEDELRAAWNGERDIPFRDHRIQSLIIDAINLREAQARAKAVAAKPVPPVQRPGVPPVRGAQKEAELKSLADRLEQTGNVKAAFEYLKARRAAG